MAQVLIVDDELRFRELYRQTLEEAGFSTLQAGTAAEALALLKAHTIDMVISDVRMPGDDGLTLLQQARELQPEPAVPFLLVTAHADIREAVRALKLGAVDYLSKPIDLNELCVAVQDALSLQPSDVEELRDIPPEALAGLVVESPVMKALLADAFRVASSDVPVLLTGESGVGKEVFADFIHRQSTRHKGPMVAVNCGAIPHALLGSELFGHEKGAFTGATHKRLGRFQEADGGTLFLDELGELSLDLQPSLLRVLETSEIVPVGSDQTLQIDYRLIAATNRALDIEVKEGRFRSDLYYRLNVIILDIPPLRQRQEEILPLARRCLASHNNPKRLSRAASRILTTYHWPGNIRELANVMERAHLLSRTDVILPEHLPPALRATEHTELPVPLPSEELRTGDIPTLEELEFDAIKRVLEKTNGNRTKAAEILGITRRGLIYKLKRIGL